LFVLVFYFLYVLLGSAAATKTTGLMVIFLTHFVVDITASAYCAFSVTIGKIHRLVRKT